MRRLSKSYLLSDVKQNQRSTTPPGAAEALAFFCGAALAAGAAFAAGASLPEALFFGAAAAFTCSVVLFFAAGAVVFVFFADVVFFIYVPLPGRKAFYEILPKNVYPVFYFTPSEVT